MSGSCDVAIVGSGFAGSLLARVLAILGYDVVLLERGTHPRFAIGESSTPLANLSLERLGARYGMADCYHLAAHGRWLARFPEIRRGLKRGFTFYRHHAHEAFADGGLDSERLLVAASPEDRVADSHWMREDIDYHFVREAIAAGVDYRDRTSLSSAEILRDGVALRGSRDDSPVALRARFLVDASGPAGFLARQLAIPSGVDRTATRSTLLYSHFDDVQLMDELYPALAPGPYPDDWAAVHHLIDEGWMYSLRFDDGVTSAGFLLTPAGLHAVRGAAAPDAMWSTLLERYPTLDELFADAVPRFPIRFHSEVQHRLTRAAGERWVLMPHAYAFVDPLFSTGITWSLLAVERLALAFENAKERRPSVNALNRYNALLGAEADQIDMLVAGAYKSMEHFELFAAQTMLYFAAVSFAESSQRIAPVDDVAWSGLLGVDDDVIRPLPAESLRRLRAITSRRGTAGTATDRRAFAEWIAAAIAARNVAGLAAPARRNLYPVDLDALIDQHHLLGLSRDQMIAALPALRGLSPEPEYVRRSVEGRATSPRVRSSPAPGRPAPR